jgi:hypothetical protein
VENSTAAPQKLKVQLPRAQQSTAVDTQSVSSRISKMPSALFTRAMSSSMREQVRQNALHTDNGILFSLKKEGNPVT